MDPIIGTIILFAGDFPPRGWAFCNGQVLSIQSNTALFSILGTTYGGDGQRTFALPDLRSRVPVGVGQGPGLSSYAPGQTGGVEAVTLLNTHLPAHNHTLQAAPANASAGPSVVTAPAGGAQAVITQHAGSNQPHENRQPFLALNYIIATEGVYPSRA
jgi:microcystin-dependent protein